MSELPPDPARLHAILAHIDRQLADNNTVATYLRLQRDAVQKALAATARPRGEQQQRQPARRLNAPTGDGSGYMLETKRHPKDPLPAILHIDDCTMANRNTSTITKDQFRVGLRDPEHMEPCGYCRPEDRIDTP